MLSLMSCAVESLISATTCSSSRHHTGHHTASPAPHQPLWLVGLPCFAPTGDLSKGTFSGICRGARTTTRYSIEFFPTCPPALLYLTGIVDLFQLHVGLRSRITPPGIVVSCEKDFLTTFTEVSQARHKSPRTETDDMAAWEDVIATENELLLLTCGDSTIPVGTTTDPLLGLQVTASWTDISEMHIIDNSIMTSFDPFTTSSSSSSTSSAAAAAAGNGEAGGASLNHPINSSLVVEAELTRRNAYELSHHGASRLGEFVPVVVSEFQRICEEDGALHGGGSSTGGITGVSGALATTDELQLLSRQIVFPDADERDSTCYSSLRKRTAELVEQLHSSTSPAFPLLKDPRQIFWPTSFVSRFSHIAAAKLERGDDVLALWLMAIDELNRRISQQHRCSRDGSTELGSSASFLNTHWTDVIGFPRGTAPMLDAPLIIQKLQLVQFCGELLQEEEEMVKRQISAASVTSSRDGGGSAKHAAAASNSKDGWADVDDDDLFSCDDAPNDEGSLSQEVRAAAKSVVVGHEILSAVPKETAQSPAESSKVLILVCGERAHNPPQSPPPIKTVDQVEQAQKSLTDLGGGRAASAYRTFLQSHDTLLQDMCLFLWANRMFLPHVLFEDFVRWHSPRDFDEEGFQRDLAHRRENEKEYNVAVSHLDVGKYLSPRMSKTGPDAVWYKLWQEEAFPLNPKEVQRKGLDPHREILVAMQWLANNVSSHDLLVLICQSNGVAGALHRVLSHHLVLSRPRIAQHLLHFGSRVGDAAGKLSRLQSASSFSTFSEVQALENAMSYANACVAEAEAELGCVISLDRVLERRCLAAPSSSSSSIRQHIANDDDDDATSRVEEVMCLLDTLIVGGGSVSLGDPDHQPYHRSPRSKKVRLSTRQWLLLQELFRPEEKSLPVEKRYRLECMAERPLNSPASRQVLVADVAAGGSLRIGLSLTEEMM